MKELKEVVYVVDGLRSTVNGQQRECFNFESLVEAQEFVDKCLEEERFGRIDLFRECHSRRLLSSSSRNG